MDSLIFISVVWLRAARVFLESEAKKMVKQREQQHTAATATQQQVCAHMFLRDYICCFLFRCVLASD